MNILHTSDWHLGCTIHGRKRYDEHEAFLDWLIEAIASHRVEALLISGDIFDSSVPSNRSLAHYYRFLNRVSATCCRHVIIIGGNHDSPSLLEAPRELLRNLNIHVVAQLSSDPDDEIIAIADDSGELQVLVCAVPYLRDRQIRSSQAGESIEQKGRNLVSGITDHYREVCSRAEQIRDGADIALIVMGHLFASGAVVGEQDGERELYVGSLAHVPISAFPEGIDYLALGHLHRAQQIGGTPRFRYSGAPLPMSFASTGTPTLCLLHTNGRHIEHTLIEVPSFIPLISIHGDLPDIIRQLDVLAQSPSPAWVEIRYTGSAIVADLPQQIEDTAAESNLRIVRIVNTALEKTALRRTSNLETLDQLSPTEVFDRCLNSHKVPEEQQTALRQLFQQALHEFYEHDDRAE